MARVPRVKLGSQGLEVSAQGLGCMSMSAAFYGTPKPEPDMINLIHHAINAGVTFLDTSDFYGPKTNEILLGKVPEMVNTNKGNIYMSTTSPPSVIKAYRGQFQCDFFTFLKCRAEEVVSGGRMVLTILGRQSDDPCSKECCYVWDLLDTSLNDMVAEGLIEEEKLDSFNIPQYTPSPKEVNNEVEKEGSFMIDRLEVSEVNWDASTYHNLNLSREHEQGYNMGKCMRAVAEPLVLSHFGESVIEEVFKRYTNNIKVSMSREKTTLVNVTVSMTRKG